MRRIWGIFKADCRNATRNTIALIVCVGLVVIPSLYAWFNIAGSWDPYGNTKNLKVAVANTDAGYSSDAVPVELNIGERVTSKLRENTAIGYVITSEEDALEGVRSGEYYAAIVIPEDFTKSMLSLTDDQIEPATLTYYSNEKENAIAPIVTDKAVTAVRTNIESSFAEAVGEVGVGVVDELSGVLDDDQTMKVAGNLRQSIEGSSEDLRTIASHIRAYAALLDSAGAIVQSSDGLLDTIDGNADAVLTSLGDAARDVRKANDSLSGVSGTISDALAGSAGSFDDVATAVDKALGDANANSAQAASDLHQLSSDLDGVIDSYEDLKSALEKVADDPLLTDSERALVESTISRVDTAIAQQKALQQTIDRAADSLESGAQVSDADREAIQKLIKDNASQVSAVRDDFEKNLSGSIGKLADAIAEASTSADTVSTLLSETVGSLEQTSALATRDISAIAGQLEDAADSVEKMADDLDDLEAKLTEALTSDDIAQVRTILSASPEALAKFISSPVGIDRIAVYPIENTGSAMAAFYTTLSLWVGAIVLVAMMKVKVSPKELEAVGGDIKPRHVYLGRLGIFLLLGFLQASLVAAGDLWYLGVQSPDPVGFMVTCWVTSFVFVNIMYAFTVSFGDIGKAVCVFLLVIQVAGSGGTFPVEMLPKAFQLFYPFLPFVHTITALHECIGGHYGMVWGQEIGALLAYVVPCLVLGLLLRKPVVRLNEWYMGKLEDTKVM